MQPATNNSAETQGHAGNLQQVFPTRSLPRLRVRKHWNYVLQCIISFVLASDAWLHLPLSDAGLKHLVNNLVRAGINCVV